MGGKIENGLHLFSRDVKILKHLVDRRALQIFKDCRDRHARSSKNPGVADLSGDTLNHWALRPIQTCDKECVSFCRVHAEAARLVKVPISAPKWSDLVQRPGYGMVSHEGPASGIVFHPVKSSVYTKPSIVLSNSRSLAGTGSLARRCSASSVNRTWRTC